MPAKQVIQIEVSRTDYKSISIEWLLSVISNALTEEEAQITRLEIKEVRPRR